MEQNYGVITEQGDLGLGYKPLTEQEQRQLKESENEQDNRQK